MFKTCDMGVSLLDEEATEHSFQVEETVNAMALKQEKDVANLNN